MAITTFRMLTGPAGVLYQQQPDTTSLPQGHYNAEIRVELDDEILVGVVVHSGSVTSRYKVSAPFGERTYPIGTNILAMGCKDKQMNDFIDWICDKVREAQFADA